MATVAGFAELEFELSPALLASIRLVFNKMDSGQLFPENVAAIPEDQGVYQLILNDKIVYIGKTDAEAGLKRRLERHAYAIQQRKNLNPSDVRFKAVRVFVFTPMDLETSLIKTYSPLWNKSGFGSNDPGRNRDFTEFKEFGFHKSYPIDIDRQLDIQFSEPATVAQVAWQLKVILPYTFRFQTSKPKSRTMHPEFLATNVALAPCRYTTRSIIQSIVEALPAGWQATLFPSHVILYRESRTYPFGTVIAQKTS